MDKKIIKLGNFSMREFSLWLFSTGTVLISFFAFSSTNYLSLCASLIGVTALIFNAKGNFIGQILTIVFSVFYGIISYSYRYYGEMITYLGMTAPMALLALIAWIKNPYKGNHAEVKVNKISKKEVIFSFVLTFVVTWIFYFILKYFNTENLLLSTVSVATSFIAVYLTFRRNPYFAIAYACNDIVLISLWIFASLEDSSYLSVVICFAMFFINDIYGFINWQKMSKRQRVA